MTLRPLFSSRSSVLSASAVFAALLSSADPTPTLGDKQPAPKLATLARRASPLADGPRTTRQQTSEPVADQMGDPDPVRRPRPETSPVLGSTRRPRRQGQRPRRSPRARRRRPGQAARRLAAAAAQPQRPLPHYALNAISAKLDLETDARTYTASVEVAWEPHLLPILLETRPHIPRRPSTTPATPPRRRRRQFPRPGGRPHLPAVDVTLPPLIASVRSLSLLEGELYAVAPTKMLTFTFDSLDQLAKAAPDDPRLQPTQEGVVCRVEPGRHGGRSLVGRSHARLPEGNVKLDSYQSWVVNNEMLPGSKDGDRFPSSSYLLEESTPRHAVLTYNFTDKEKMKRGLAGLEARLPHAGARRQGPDRVLLQGRAAAVTRCCGGCIRGPAVPIMTPLPSPSPEPTGGRS